MIKGINRQMIVISTEGSRFFDEAYFVLRRGVSERGNNRAELLREANRIIEESVAPTERRARPRRKLFLFLLGGLCGGALVFFLSLLLR